MPSSRSHIIHSLLFLTGSVTLTACEQPLVVRAAPAPSVEAETSAAAAIAGGVDPADLARARAGLDALAAAWSSPGATALHEQGANAQRENEMRARTLSQPGVEGGRDARLRWLAGEAARAAVASPAHP
jgi:hypothetical protein